MEKMTDELDEMSQAVALRLAQQGYLQAPKKRKPRVNWESRMVREFATQNWPRNLKWYRHEVGPYDPNNPAEANGQLRRWVDLIIDDDDKIVLYEAKMRPDQRAISQIDLYLQLFPQTPEFEYYANKPIRGVLLTTAMEPTIKATCDRWGIGYEVFVPSFMQEYNNMIIERYKRE
jgi:hypothetical protein